MSDLEGVPKWKEGLETLKNIGINIVKHQTNEELSSGVTNYVVEESFIWLGFKRPSTYWG